MLGTRFRDRKIAASLKRDREVVVEVSGRMFPRSKDRGLIEASRHRAGPAIPGRFRDRKIAASLKRLARDPTCTAQRGFRNRKIAASLKRGDLVRDKPWPSGRGRIARRRPKPVTGRADKGKSECQTPLGEAAVLARALRRNKPATAKASG